VENSIITYFKWAINAHLAFFIYLIKRNKSNLWLLGGLRGEIYSDNAKVFYEYLIDEHPNIKPVWVARAGSSAYLQAAGEVVAKGSIKNYLYFYNAQIAVFSDTFNHDIAPGVFLLPVTRLFYDRIFKVRLNHGTISFKKRVAKAGFSGLLSDRIMLSYDLSTASTQLEKTVMESYARPNSVSLTGSARNDKVFDVELREKVILLSPTWRPWLRHSDDFLESDFYQTYSALLSAPSFIKFLRGQNIKLILHLHHLMLPKLNYFRHLACDEIVIDELDECLHQTIIGCSLLITDYSSICAERYLLRKPVLFFQFDQPRYVSEVGSYIDLENQSFGLVSKDINHLIDLIKDVFKPSYQTPSQQIDGERYFVHYKDNGNCQRIYAEIVNRVAKKNTSF